MTLDPPDHPNCRCVSIPDPDDALECVGGPWDGETKTLAPGESTIVVVRGPVGFVVDRPDGRRATYLPAPMIAGIYRRADGRAIALLRSIGKSGTAIGPIPPTVLRWETFPP